MLFAINDRTGTMAITDSALRGNPSAGFETPGLPGIFFLGAGRPAITRSLLERSPAAAQSASAARTGTP